VSEAVSPSPSVPVRRRLGECLQEISRGVGDTWSRFKVVGATRSGIAPAKEPVGKNPERYKLVEPGTIFYNPMRILLGSIAMIDDGQEPGITSPDYVVFRSKDGVVHPRWLYYWLRSPDGSAFIKTLARGAVRERILFRRLAVGEIDVPPYETQQRFAAAMLVVERARAGAKARLEVARRLREAILRDFFRAASHYHAESLASLANSGDAFADGPFGSNLKTEHYRVGGARVVRLQNIGRGEFLDDDKAYVSDEHYRMLFRHAVRPDDMIVAALGDGARPAGRACLIPAGFGPGMVKADCFRVRLPSESADPRFLMHWLNSPQHLKGISRLMRGATRPRFTLRMLRDTEVPMPPLPVQERIARETDKRLSVSHAGRVASQKVADALDALPTALLRRAFRGEL
jgi:restriction endonuclease S subunit